METVVQGPSATCGAVVMWRPSEAGPAAAFGAGQIERCYQLRDAQGADVYVVVATEWRLVSLENSPTTSTFSLQACFKAVVLASNVFYKPAYIIDGTAGTILRPSLWRRLL